MTTQDETQTNTSAPLVLRHDQQQARSTLFALMPYHMVVYYPGSSKVMNRKRLAQLIVGVMLPWQAVLGAVEEMYALGKFKTIEKEVVMAELKVVELLCRRSDPDYE